MRKQYLISSLACALTIGLPCVAAEDQPPDFAADVAPILAKYCAGCHGGDEPEGKLVLESFAGIEQGGEHGKVVVAGKSEESKLILVLQKQVEPFMPPDDNPAPTAEEIAVLKAWIAAGAIASTGQMTPQRPEVPQIAIRGEARKPILAVAWSPDGKTVAAARHAVVEIIDDAGKLLYTLGGHAGHVNRIGFSRDGKTLWAAGGDPGLVGEVVLWSTADWSQVRRITGHADSIYAADLSADGARLATGSYDKTIKLWETASGRELATLEGHHGPVLDLAFHPGGKLLASASDDRTIKLWDAERGQRLDTFIEPTKAQYAVTISPDGRFIVAGGVDNRIRAWEITAGGKEGTNRLRWARFAHEAAILRLAFSTDGEQLVSSAEDNTIKVWNAADLTQRRLFDAQSDWATGVAFAPDAAALVVGRLDGSFEFYPLAGQSAHAQLSEPVRIADYPSVTVAALEGAMAQIAESEPNNAPENATPLTLPSTATATFAPPGESGPDVDLYRFSAKQGETWMIEAKAAGDNSRVDTKVEVLHADGSPVLRLQLRAIRDSNITFRPIDSDQTELRVTNWEEMQLNQYMYLGGEVCRLFRAPRGPDSGFTFYTVAGKRRCYFDTSGVVHANDEPVYIVEPYAPGAMFASNGLPVFPIYYANDDDGWRKLGRNSRLAFTAPADGEYLVRVTDVRGFGGDDFTYTLSVRPPRPDFAINIDGKDAKVGAGSGKRLRFTVDRIDDFEGEIQIDIAGVPAGYSVASPIQIEAGHAFADSVVFAAADAQPGAAEAWAQVTITAAAHIGGQDVSKSLGSLGTVELQEKSKVLVRLEPDWSGESAEGHERELLIAPGSSITAMLSIERNGFEEELTFDVDNLPHGVIVDDIGLNGILIRKGESERRVFLKAADWVGESTRWIDAVALGAGNPASLPIKLRVRRGGTGEQVASAASPETGAGAPALPPVAAPRP